MRVLISGAGIAGPCLAWFLARNTGSRITVLEKAPSLLAHGQNIDIQGSAQLVVDTMGLLDEVRQNNTSEKGTQLIDPRGRPFAPFPVVTDGSAPSLSSEFEILRADLARVFYDATADRANVDYRFGQSVSRILADDERGVRVQLSTGEVQEYDLLVAADGQWSKLRTQVFPPDSITVVDKNMYVVYFTVPRLARDNDWWNIYSCLPSKTITVRPDPHGTIRAMFTLMPCTEGQKRAWQDVSRGDRRAQEELTREAFTGAGWEADRLLDEMVKAPDFYFQHVQQIGMHRWSDGRVVCLGDAAAALSPVTGMGTSCAILGAYVLAGELSQLAEGEHPSRALGAYEAAFRPFVDKVQKVPWWVPGIGHPDTTLKRWALQTFLAVVSRLVAVPWIGRRLGGDEGIEFVLPLYPEHEGESKRVKEQVG